MKPTEPVFVERRGYRFRRAVDAARLLPLVGVLAFLLPLLSVGGRTGIGAIYLFSAWFGLVILTGICARIVNRGAPDEGERQEPPADP